MHRLPVVPNLLDRYFNGWRPNQAWVSDIAVVRTGGGWLYLAAILDLASRRIVGWSMSERIASELVCQVAQRVLATQAAIGLAVAFRSRRSICQLRVPETGRHVKSDPYFLIVKNMEKSHHVDTIAFPGYKKHKA